MDGVTGFDIMALPLDRFCNFVIQFMRAHMKDTDYIVWRDAIERPPDGVEVEAGAWSDEEMMRQFQSFRTP
jgi:hypothetical protein